MISEDGFMGRGRGITLGASATAYLHHLERRVVTITTTGASAKVFLPTKAGRILGGPYFYLYLTASSTHSLAVEDGDAAAIVTLTPGQRALVTLEAIAGGLRAFRAKVK